MYISSTTEAKLLSPDTNDDDGDIHAGNDDK